MLWIALRFPSLPLEAVGIDAQQLAPVVIEQQHRVFMATRGALDLGVREQMKVATVSAFADCQVLARQPEMEEQALLRLASWAYNHTPYIQRYSDNSLLLEVSRCLRLSGGLQALVRRLSEALDQMPHQWQMGVAHTGKGAWLLSFDQQGVSDNDSQALFISRLHQVPLDRLPEQPKAVAGLMRMGLKNLGDVLALPSPELGRRFGEDFLRFLDELVGSDRALPAVFQAEETFCRQIPFNWPVRNISLLELPAQQLLKQLVDYLVRQQRQCQQIQWHLYAADSRERQTLTIGCERVHQHWELLFDLTRIRLERLQLDFEVQMIELECPQTTPVEQVEANLFANESMRIQGNVESLVAKLQTRFGSEHLYQVRPLAEHLPEKAQVREAPLKRAVASRAGADKDSYINSEPAPPHGARPCWLLPQPQPLQRVGDRLFWSEQRQRKALRIVEGPERIEGYWWDQPQARDYFIARREDATHIWIYRELDSLQRWYVQGIFA